MGNIYQSITAIMDEGYAITKEKRNQQQGFMYRGIDDVMNTFHPLLSKHHVFVVPEVLEEQRQERTSGRGGSLLYSILKIKYTFYAEDGTSISAIVIGEGMDSGDKASNKAMSVAMKYAMFQVFCIPTEEMQDPDAETPPPSTKKEQDKKLPPSEAKKEPSKSPPTEEKQDLHFRCEKCGNILTPYKDDEGRTVPIRKHAEGSREKFGHVYCLNCIQSMQQRSDLDGIVQQYRHEDAGDRV